jgi:3-hydroxyisobutyrate dehydrogenase-like beta-hydroxyacid dehydrogenase
MKIARNMLHFISFAAACEAQKLAKACGVSLHDLGNVVRHTDALTCGAGAIMFRDNTKPHLFGTIWTRKS